jgi:hypothetical protein
MYLSSTSRFVFAATQISQDLALKTQFVAHLTPQSANAVFVNYITIYLRKINYKSINRERNDNFYVVPIYDKRSDRPRNPITEWDEFCRREVETRRETFVAVDTLLPVTVTHRYVPMIAIPSLSYLTDHLFHCSAQEIVESGVIFASRPIKLNWL